MKHPLSVPRHEEKNKENEKSLQRGATRFRALTCWAPKYCFHSSARPHFLFQAHPALPQLMEGVTYTDGLFLYTSGSNKVCQDGYKTLLQRCILFAFNKELSFVYAAEAKRTNDVSPHPSLI